MRVWQRYVFPVLLVVVAVPVATAIAEEVVYIATGHRPTVGCLGM